MDSIEEERLLNNNMLSRTELEEELKRTQLSNSQLRQEVQSLRARINELEIEIPTGEKEKQLDGVDEIAGIARKFCVMHEAFIPKDLRLLDLKPSTTKVDIFDAATRYVSKSTQLQGFAEEVFYVLPAEIHGVIQHSQVFKKFKRSHANERSHQISVIRASAPRIFRSIGTFSPDQFDPDNKSRQQDIIIRRLIGADDGYPVWAPLLFPDLNTKNMDKVFASPCLQLLLKFMLFKNHAFNNGDTKKAGAKPAVNVWNVTSATPGFVAFGAIVARFLFSPDNRFEAKGDVSSINYAEDFITYKRFLLTTLRQKVPAIVALFKELNGVLFGNGEIELDTSALGKEAKNDANAPLTNHDFDDAMQRLLEGPPAAETGTSISTSLAQLSLDNQPMLLGPQAEGECDDKDGEQGPPAISSSTTIPDQDACQQPPVTGQDHEAVQVAAVTEKRARGRGQGTGSGRGRKSTGTGNSETIATTRRTRNNNKK